MDSIFIVEIIDDGETYKYEYGNLVHAREHYNNEITAYLYEYKNGNYYLVDCKSNITFMAIQYQIIGGNNTMNGNKKTFTDGQYFYKEYSKNEFMFLKMLHGIDNLHLDTITKDNTEYIEMPKGHVISIDTIPKEKRQYLRIIIFDNIPFMLEQISYLNALGIYYSDCMQWLYYNDKMYLIDFDTAYLHDINIQYNNYDLFKNFLSAFNIDYSWISESLHFLDLFQDGIDFCFKPEEIELYNKLHDETMTPNHVYYCRNTRHIQINNKNIHIYGESGNMVITENLLNPEIVNEWELIKIA
jgi:hypothetical protein